MPAVTRSINNRRVVSFSRQAEGATQVSLAGTFNDWNPEATPMTQDSAGYWTAALEVAPGSHEYRYIVDGQWSNELECMVHESCPNCIPNSYGSKNQKLEVA